jgi:hypothetical protein
MKTLKSRYSLCSPSQNYCVVSSASGVTQSKSNSGLEQGYVFVPYILVESTPIILDDYWNRQLRIELLKKQRIEKLKKLNW